MNDLANLVEDMVSSKDTVGSWDNASERVAAWKIVEEAVKSKASAAMRDRNALLPVHQVPLELLTNVFEMVLAEETGGYYRHLKRLGRVCFRWREAVGGTATLWTEIQNSDSNGIIDEAFRRSAECPLDVVFKTRSPESIKFIVKALRSHRNRVRSLNLLFLSQATWKMTEEFISSPLLSLESCTLACTMVLDLGNTVLFAHHAPKLISLCLSGFFIETQELVVLLNQFQGLRNLGLKGLTFESVPDANPGHIRLLALRSLNLDTAPRILEHLHAPLCRSLNVGLGHVSNEWLTEILQRNLPNWVSQDIEFIDVRIESRGVQITYYVATSSAPFHFFLTDRSMTTEMLIVIATLLDNHPCSSRPETHLTITSCVLHIMSYSRYVAQIGRLTRVTRLQVGDVRLGCDLPTNPPYYVCDLPAFPDLREALFFQQRLNCVRDFVKFLRGEVITIYIHFSSNSLTAPEKRLAQIKQAYTDVTVAWGEDRVVFVPNPLAQKFHPDR